MMKIFEINTGGEREWVAAETNIQALKFYTDLTGYSLDDFDDDDSITEIEESKWDDMIVTDEDSDEKWTFREVIKGLVKPDMIASTAY